MSAEMLEALHQELATFSGTPFEKVRLITGAPFEEREKESFARPT
jgi:hypothetical protein